MRGLELDTPPCVAAARRFDVARHRPFVIGDAQVGWLREDDARLLQRWPALFEQRGGVVLLAPRFETPDARSAALQEAAVGLLDVGRLRGWRDEIYAIRNRFEAVPFALIERAAARFFGIATYAVHANGVVLPGGADESPGTAADPAPSLWIARRSLAKPTDPGMLDNLVGGGIAWGYGVTEALVKEAWEESGLPETVTERAMVGRSAYILNEVEQGTQVEQLFIFDIALPAGFAPSAQDGEVSEHRQVDLAALGEIIASGTMTVDATIATLDCCQRHGWLRVRDAPAYEALFAPPAPPAGASFFR
ncbi:NUDIX hydrolase [Chitinasiproducens palmae]|uniref:NUDIX domain-containing protein n=1 Tax=Chitinasiproducens palmae TaxID=1770053 RepID=A0A1H2PPH7_9BURK|nr:DUF4743 domain-containing protein [Chitinasiproducens palmae]SDV48197.1 NUDIX domain-containing protein [Chitinasiproducens palmae]